MFLVLVAYVLIIYTLRNLRFDLFDSCARYKFSSFIHSFIQTVSHSPPNCIGRFGEGSLNSPSCDGVFSARHHIAYMLSALYAIARPSVRLSVIRVDHTKTAEVTKMKLSSYGSPIPLVYAGLVTSRNSYTHGCRALTLALGRLSCTNTVCFSPLYPIGIMLASTVCLDF